MSAFLLPDETRVSQVRLRVRDLGRALGFYEGVLGLRTIRRGQHEAALSATGSATALLVLEEQPAAPPRPARSTGLYHVAYRYPTDADLANALLRLGRHHWPVDGASDHRVSKAIYLSDPEDNGVELYTDRPRAEWAWRQGQVTMTTEYLDIQGLLRSATGELANDASPPPNLDIGHIHLQVSDLPAAERFYADYLGLAVTQRSYPGALFYAAGGYHHHIATNTWGATTPAPEGAVGLVSYRLEVPVAEILYCLRQRAPLVGFDAVAETSSPEGDILRIRDPNRNWLELVASARQTSPH
jgi:catechol 2,3-dioxygenase